MAAVQPAPTVTTSTFLCTVTVTASLVLHAGAADRQDHVLVGVLPCVERVHVEDALRRSREVGGADLLLRVGALRARVADQDRKSTRLNSSHVRISYAVFCLKKK